MLKLGLIKHIAVHGVLQHCSFRSVDEYGKLMAIIDSHWVLREVLTPKTCRMNYEIMKVDKSKESKLFPQPITMQMLVSPSS